VTYDECVARVDFLNARFRKAGMRPWYTWAIRMDWPKIVRWCSLLGYKKGKK